MSRRRRAPRGPVSRSPYATKVTVICTGRGAHKRYRVDSITVWQSEPDAAIEIEMEIRRPQPVLEEGDPRLVARFVCARCRRDVPLRMEKLRAVISTLRDAGIPDLDISALQAAKILKQ